MNGHVHPAMASILNGHAAACTPKVPVAPAAPILDEIEVPALPADQSDAASNLLRTLEERIIHDPGDKSTGDPACDHIDGGDEIIREHTDAAWADGFRAGWQVKHTPEPWIADGGYRVQGDCSGHRYDILHLDQTPMHVPDVNQKANADRICACVNALRGLDVAKVEALLDAVRAEAALPNHAISAYNDSIRATERAISALADSIRAGGGQ